MKNVVAGLALALTLPVAMADTATARLSNLAISVVDLDTTDTHVPSSEWSQNVGRSELSYIVPGQSPINLGRDLSGAPDTLGLERPGASIAAEADWAEGLLEATADVTTAGAAYAAFTSRDIKAPGLLFLIPPKTSVTLSADAFLSAATDYLCASSCFGASAFAGLNLTVGSRQLNDAIEVSAGAGTTFDTLSRQLTLTYSNTTGEAQWATLSASVEIAGEVVPVPEPESYALMGLGLVGLMLHRARKARQAQAQA